MARTFRQKGERFQKGYQPRSRASKWITDESAYYAIAKKDLIDHHCRCCQFEWESDPIKQQSKKP